MRVGVSSEPSELASSLSLVTYRKGTWGGSSACSSLTFRVMRRSTVLFVLTTLATRPIRPRFVQKVLIACGCGFDGPEASTDALQK